jgi:hypothetical protein
MEQIQKVNGYKTADGKLHENLENARQSVLEALVTKAVNEELKGGGELCPDDVRNFFLMKFDPIRLELDRIMNGVR